MPHDHYVMVPMTAQGAYTDPNIGPSLTTAMSSPFAFTDVFLYSHGWWTTAEDAMNDYSRFSIGLAGVILFDRGGGTTLRTRDRGPLAGNDQ